MYSNLNISVCACFGLFQYLVFYEQYFYTNEKMKKKVAVIPQNDPVRFFGFFK